MGHLMRCLSLADYLKQNGYKCHFLARNFNTKILNVVKRSQHSLHLLPKKKMVIININKSKFIYSDWLQVTQQVDFMESYKFIKKINPGLVVVDHYGIDKTWHLLAKQRGLKLFVLDDLGDRQHYCDILLDTTPGRKKDDYLGKINREAILLLGNNYCIIRDEFLKLRKLSLRRDRTRLSKLMVSMGGMDADNNTLKIMEKLKTLDLDIKITFIMGNETKDHKKIIALSKQLNVKNMVLPYSTSISKLMLESDLAIGTPSVTALERCCMGLPSINITTSRNQKTIASNLEDIGAAIDLGRIEKLSSQKIVKTINNIYLNKKYLKSMSVESSKVCDGLGKDRILEKINDL